MAKLKKKQARKLGSVIEATRLLGSARWHAAASLEKLKEAESMLDEVEPIDELGIAVKALRTIANTDREDVGSWARGLALGALRRMNVGRKKSV